MKLGSLVARQRIKEELGKDWSIRGRELTKLFQFASPDEAMSFASAVFKISKGLGHHPDIFIQQNEVRLMLITHEEGGLTDKDFQLAKKIDEIDEKRAKSQRHNEPDTTERRTLSVQQRIRSTVR